MINLNDFPKNQNCILIEQLNDTAYFRRQTLSGRLCLLECHLSYKKKQKKDISLIRGEMNLYRFFFWIMNMILKTFIGTKFVWQN